MQCSAPAISLPDLFLGDVRDERAEDVQDEGEEVDVERTCKASVGVDEERPLGDLIPIPPGNAYYRGGPRP